APQRMAAGVVAPAPVRVAAAEEGDLDSWVRQHASVARDATLLGPAEEVEFASFDAAAGSAGR
ncbi:MAG TPA: hypothetical protein VI078_01880, partial [bacterium]